MHFDNGTELINAEMKAWAGQRGIELEVTAPYSQSQNGVAERFNHTHMELAQAMLFAKGLLEFLWDQAVAHANYLHNRAPTWALKGSTPYEAWHGHKPNVLHLREFGCNIWILNESKNCSKLHLRSHKMIFVGFDNGAKCIRYYDKATQHVKRSQNFKFNENEEPWDLEIVEVPGLQADREKLDSTPSQTTPAEPEPQQLNLRHRTVDFTDAPQGRRAPSHTVKPIILSEPPDIIQSTESSHVKNVNPEQAHMATKIIFKSIFRDATFFSAQEEELTDNHHQRCTKWGRSWSIEKGCWWRTGYTKEDGDLGACKIARRKETHRMQIGICEEKRWKRKTHQIQSMALCTRIFTETWYWFQQWWNLCTSYAVWNPAHFSGIHGIKEMGHQTIWCKKCLSTYMDY